MQLSGRSCAKKGGFQLISLALLQVLNLLTHLLLIRAANHFEGSILHGDDSNLPDWTYTGTRKKNRHDPKAQFSQDQMFRYAAQASERVMTDNVSIRSLADCFSPIAFGLFAFGQGSRISPGAHKLRLSNGGDVRGVSA
jgi:hypothetical protein